MKWNREREQRISKNSIKKRDDLGGLFVDWFTDEILFYGGIVVAAGSFFTAVVYFLISQIRRVRLNARLDIEYGEKEK